MFNEGFKWLGDIEQFMAYTVFLSYGGGDEDLVKAINDSLLRFNNLDPFVAEWIQMAGTHLETKVKMGLNRSFAVIVLISNNSLTSQWMQQEIGYGIAKNKHIIPLVERGVQIRGFLEAKEYIPLDRGNFNQCIYLILNRLNSLLGANRYTSPLGELKIQCTTCNNAFLVKTPNQEFINNTIQKQQIFVFPCPKCKNNIQVDPFTFGTIPQNQGWHNQFG